MPGCGRQPSAATESVRRQISYLFDDEPRTPAAHQPSAVDAFAVNWGVPRANAARAA